MQQRRVVPNVERRTSENNKKKIGVEKENAFLVTFVQRIEHCSTLLPSVLHDIQYFNINKKKKQWSAGSPNGTGFSAKSRGKAPANQNL